MSKYAVSVGGNAMSGSEQIKPISFEYAKRWAEEKLTADEYEKLFGEVAEDDREKSWYIINGCGARKAKTDGRETRNNSVCPVGRVRKQLITKSPS